MVSSNSKILFAISVILISSLLLVIPSSVAGQDIVTCSNQTENLNNNTVYLTTDTDGSAKIEIPYTDSETDEIQRCTLDKNNYDGSNIDFKPTYLEIAATVVNPDGEIVVEEHSQFGGENDNGNNAGVYEGGVLGTGDGVLSGSKDFTIRGEDQSIPVIVPPKNRNVDSPLIFTPNQQKQIKVENVVLAKGETALDIESRSNVYLEDISIDGTIDPAYFDFEPTISVPSKSDGSVLRVSNVYYPDDFENDEYVYEDQNVITRLRVQPSQIPNADIDEYIFQSQDTVPINDPVVAGNYNLANTESDRDRIIVNPDTGSDDSVINLGFESLESAVSASDRGQTILVSNKDGSYNNTDITGFNIGEDHSLEIKGVDGVPKVMGFDVSHSGIYELHNLHITEEIKVTNEDVSMDLSKNYWNGMTNTNNILNSMISGIDESDVLSLSPSCEDEDCENLEYNDIENFCYTFEDMSTETGQDNIVKVGCDDGEDIESNLDIKFLGFNNQEDNIASDSRTGDIKLVPNDIPNGVDIRINILESDSNIDGIVNIPPGTDKSIIKSFDSTFSNLRLSSDMRPEIEFNPTFSISVQETELNRVNKSLITKELNQNISIDSLVNVDPGDTVFGDRKDGQFGSIIDGNTDDLVKRQTTKPTRFSSGSGSMNYRNQRIPPVIINSNGLVDSSVGILEDFGNVRADNSRPAVVEPNGRLNVGISFENLPPADKHFLELQYAYAANSTSQNNINLDVVDSSSSEIYESRDDSTETIKPTAKEGAFESGVAESQVDLVSKSIELHPVENSYIEQNGEIYLTFENDNFVTSDDEDVNPRLFLFGASLISTDVIENNENVSNNTNPIKTKPLPGDIKVDVNVLDGNLNSDFSTYDVNPEKNNQIKYELVFENQGDQQVTGNFSIEDNHILGTGQYPDNTTSRSGIETQELESLEVTVDDQPITRQFETDWDRSEFGLHEVRVVRDDINSNQGEVGFDAYVLQDTTPEITEINIPDEHLSYDNFNAEIKIQNIGDLGGEINLEASLSKSDKNSIGDWKVKENITLTEGNTRRGESSDEVSIFYSRSNHPSVPSDVVFNRREYTTSSEVFLGPPDAKFENKPLLFDNTGNDYYRPKAPFSTQTGKHEMSVTVDNGNIGGDLFDFQSENIYLGKLQITDFNVDVNPSETEDISNKPSKNQANVYASAWPYLQPSYTGFEQFRKYNNPGNNETGGEGTMLSRTDPNSPLVNRGSFPLNEDDIGYTSQPDENYFSTFFSTHIRSCESNQDLIENGTQLPKDEVSESDVGNVFIPFSAESCNSKQRFTQVHGMRFVDQKEDISLDTTNPTNSTDDIKVEEHPNPYNIDGVNPDTFKDLDREGRVMFAHVRISNPLETQHISTARFEIVTNKTIDGKNVVGFGSPDFKNTIKIGSNRFDDNVVGAGAVRLDPQEELEFRVPIVIRNNEGSGGVHKLSIRTRADGENEEDYIKTTDNPITKRSPISGETHDRFTIPINVETYGDAVLKNLEKGDDMPDDSYFMPNDSEFAKKADTYAYTVCEDNKDESGNSRASMEGNYLADSGTFSPDLTEGLNPISGVQNFNSGGISFDSINIGITRDDGKCMNVSDKKETVTFDATYKNYGGEKIEIRPELIAEFESSDRYTNLHRQNAHATGDRYFADYQSDSSTKFDGKTFSDTPSTLELKPGEKKTVTFERKFQEPGFYHIRVSPCRDISKDGPQMYNLEGFTGIPGTISPNSPTPNPSDLITSIYGINRLNQDTDNLFSTPEFENSIFHGSRGCSVETESVFVYDQQKPVADFRIAHSKSTAKSENNRTTESRLVEQTTKNGISASDSNYTDDPVFEVYKGGILFFDGSSYDCDLCYNSDEKYDLKSDVRNPVPENGDLRNDLVKDNILNHKMSTTNTRITDMEWKIDGSDPNFGRTDICSKVDVLNGIPSEDKGCYMEAFSGGSDNMQVVSHRFTEVGEKDVQLKVEGDSDLTRGKSHTNVTSAKINVISSGSPNVSLDGKIYNDLNYSINENGHIYHRDEEVIEYADLKNFEERYNNTYEGVRYCLSAESSDNMGISQDAWYQLGDRTLVIDNGSYYSNYNDNSLENINKSETRDGDRRCVVFKEAGQSRNQNFEYEAWNFGQKSQEASQNVEVEHESEKPEFEFDYTVENPLAVSLPSPSKGDAWLSSDSYAGSRVNVEIKITDPTDIGVACADLKIQTPNTKNNTKNNCQMMNVSEKDVSWSKTYTARQLGVNSETTVDLEAKVTNWHGETKRKNISIEYVKDTTDPTDVPGGGPEQEQEKNLEPFGSNILSNYNYKGNGEFDAYFLVEDLETGISPSDLDPGCRRDITINKEDVDTVNITGDTIVRISGSTFNFVYDIDIAKKLSCIKIKTIDNKGYKRHEIKSDRLAIATDAHNNTEKLEVPEKWNWDFIEDETKPDISGAGLDTYSVSPQGYNGGTPIHRVEVSGGSASTSIVSNGAPSNATDVTAGGVNVGTLISPNSNGGLTTKKPKPVVAYSCEDDNKDYNEGGSVEVEVEYSGITITATDVHENTATRTVSGSYTYTKTITCP